jgi:SET domain-containing protein
LSSIDSTDKDVFGNRLGRLVNHASVKVATARPIVVVCKGEPHICLYATRDLNAGDQLLFSYGIKVPFVDKVKFNSCLCGEFVESYGQFVTSDKIAFSNSSNLIFSLKQFSKS